MGTDIHMALEIRKGGLWHHYTGHPPFAGRAYGAFGLLANVRNGVGVAGMDFGDPVEPISLPRGLPPDLSAALRALYATDDSTFGDRLTWVTLDEVLGVDYTKYIEDRGTLAFSRQASNGLRAAILARLRDPTFTLYYASRGDLRGADVFYLTPAEFARRVQEEDYALSQSMLDDQYEKYIDEVAISWLPERLKALASGAHDATFCVGCSWRQSIADRVGSAFLNWVRDLRIATEQSGSGPADVRLVFGFDS